MNPHVTSEENQTNVEYPIPDPPWFDPRSGLERVSGNQQYSLLLSTFSERQCRAADEIRSALRRNDVESAKRMAHTLRGVAGNIGAHELQMSARALEVALGIGEPQAWEEALDAVGKSMEQVLSTIADLQPNLEEISSDLGVTTEFDSERLGTLLSQLKLFLQKSDGRAVKAVEFIKQCARDSAVLKECEDLERLVKGFDYDAALEAVSRLHEGLDAYRGSL